MFSELWHSKITKLNKKLYVHSGSSEADKLIRFLKIQVSVCECVGCRAPDRL